MNFTKAIGIVSMAALSLVAASCGGNGKKKQTQTEQKQLVAVDTVRVEAVAQQNEYSAIVEAYATNNIAPQSSMRIKKIYVEVGDHVTKGQTLASMDNANLNSAKVQMENSETEFNRADELYKIGGISKSAWDSQKMAYEIARNTYDNLAQNTILTSPLDGLVSARNYDSGDMYSMGQPVLTVEQIRPVKLIINVSEEYFSRLKRGMPVDVTLDAYPDVKFNGRIYLIYPSVDSNTHTFKVEIRMDNRDERVRSGMFARVLLSWGTMNHVVAPDRSVVKQTGSGDRYIYAVEDGRIVFHKVELGRRMGDRYEIVSGIDDGAIVVVKGQSRLTNGMEVEIQKN
ncbi:MAG: efflux RND transporter periplasmic adaptor subunit [Bacteroidales bacterium]|jgi:RND family efflux transporter MFP subunit|nr:efflux RND transporter periplasmic adaptor subunit [Bacteroidales bacterium]MCI2122324.1 efflux RND transporter periplasmic adaptor subunit [Bacteroidales bacterium]MCI2145350.1 efflux RND transporter periplasmic adaptor subunit [Bacteroidales bacterium]